MKTLNITQYYKLYASSKDKNNYLLRKFAKDITIRKANKRLFQIEKFLSKAQRSSLHALHYFTSKQDVCDMLVELIDVDYYSEEYEKIYNSLSKYQMCIAIAILDTENLKDARYIG